jgi:hypothetical protein
VLRALPVAIAIGLIAMAIAPTAHAASSRAEYVAQANPICEAAERPVDKAIAGYVKALQRKRIGPEALKRVTEETLGPTIRFGARIATVYSNVTARLRLIPAAPGDEETVFTWLGDRDAVSMRHRAILRAYRKRKFGLGRHLSKRLNPIIARANAAGRPLGLQVECTPHGGILFEFDPFN